MTANELFSQIKDRGQKHLSMKQASWLRSMVAREFPDAASPSSPYEYNWMHNGAVRTLFITPCIGTGRIVEIEVR